MNEQLREMAVKVIDMAISEIMRDSNISEFNFTPEQLKAFMDAYQKENREFPLSKEGFLYYLIDTVLQNGLYSGMI